MKAQPTKSDDKNVLNVVLFVPCTQAGPILKSRGLVCGQLVPHAIGLAKCSHGAVASLPVGPVFPSATRAHPPRRMLSRDRRITCITS